MECAVRILLLYCTSSSISWKFAASTRVIILELLYCLVLMLEFNFYFGPDFV